MQLKIAAFRTWAGFPIKAEQAIPGKEPDDPVPFMRLAYYSPTRWMVDTRYWIHSCEGQRIFSSIQDSRSEGPGSKTSSLRLINKLADLSHRWQWLGKIAWQCFWDQGVHWWLEFSFIPSLIQGLDFSIISRICAVLCHILTVIHLALVDQFLGAWRSWDFMISTSFSLATAW